LRGLCQSDRFANDGFPLFDTVVHLSDVDVPLCAIGCETDHIAPWKDSFRGVQQMGSTSKRFIMAQSGHIAGIVNPPSKKKYGYYTNPDLNQSPEDWLQQATFVSGSWWEDWGAWLVVHSGEKKSARPVGSNAFGPISDAPGIYVRMRSSSEKIQTKK
jgi:polyhydroxyalkanoate synthase